MAEETYRKPHRKAHQCVLTRSLDKFVGLYSQREASVQTPINYTNITGDSQKARTHLSTHKQTAPLVNMSQAQLSSLIPMTKLYKDIGGGELVEFLFDEYYRTDLQSMTEPQNNRGLGAGIKSIDVAMEGDAVATAERQYKVTITFFFASVRELFVSRGDGKYSYSDLITPFRNGRPVEGCSSPQRNVGIASSNTTTRYKLEFGYAQPTNSSLFSEKEIEAIQSAKRGMFLNLYKHDVNFAENGTLTITAEYHGYIEKIMSGIDILRASLTVEDTMLLERQERSLCAIQNRDKKPSQKPVQEGESTGPKVNETGTIGGMLGTIGDSIGEWFGEKGEAAAQQEGSGFDYLFSNRGIDDKIKDLRTKGYQTFLSKILQEGKMYSFTFNPEKDLVFGKIRPKITLSRASTKDLKSGEELVNFFFLGDLLNTVFKYMDKMAQMRSDLRPNEANFALGTVSITTLDASKATLIPIASIPISLDHFQAWFKEHVIKKGERATYNLLDFVRDIFNNLVRSAFNTTCFFEEDRTVSSKGYNIPKFEINTFTSIDSYKGKTVNYQNIPLEKLNPIDAKNIYENYFIYGVNRIAEKSDGTASEVSDKEKGIYHLISGAERGITKRIKFSKDDMKYSTEATIARGNVGKSGILWGKYDANVELFGNPMFKPGMKVYIASNNMSPAEVADLGMGGYYNVTKVYNKIEGGRYSTELVCKFHNSPKRKKS